MSKHLKNFPTTQRAIDAWVRITEDGESYFTLAGLVCLLGFCAYHPLAGVGEEERCNAQGVFYRVVSAAVARGMPARVEQALLWAFSDETVNAFDGTPDGEALAVVCQQIADLFTVEQVAALIEGDTP